MRYLITFNDDRVKPFFTDWFEPENNFVDGMTIFDMYAFKYSTDGNNWKEIMHDHL